MVIPPQTQPANFTKPAHGAEPHWIPCSRLLGRFSILLGQFSRLLGQFSRLLGQFSRLQGRAA
ncbi:hypothetical protein SV7mr_42510 [Stieleria bergensis]|uniref:Uncharacterized protein n=1 Tax=Stieleria bergensis TaxID=2528025 RepID=A0A517T043_9BACT|nr:hypothetical protein SV7mr_42510 [Planctomycetes bacterium SV_7m_r]